MERKLAAIFSADVKGYSRLMGDDEIATVRTLTAYREVMAAEARAETAEVLRLNPKFSLEVHKQRMPIKDPVVLERHIAALRKAGLK